LQEMMQELVWNRSQMEGIISTCCSSTPVSVVKDTLESISTLPIFMLGTTHTCTLKLMLETIRRTQMLIYTTYYEHNNIKIIVYS